MNNKDLKIIEALIFASNEPIHEDQLKEKINDKDNLINLLNELKNTYSSRGVNLSKTGNSWSFKTSSDLSEDLIIFKKQTRKLSRAAQETLAIIAYHQPITRAEIEEIRGVQMGRGSIDYLMEIGWIKPKGRRNTPGRPTNWVTTKTFLEHYDLESLESLPNKKELKASGFLEKRSAISTISTFAKNLENSDYADDELDSNEETLDDFISDTPKDS